MEKFKNASPRPWRLVEHRMVYSGDTHITNLSVNFSGSTPMPSEVQKANNELTVEAVNSYDKLKADRDALLGACIETSHIINSYAHIPAQKKAFDLLAQAIKQAEGGAK